MADIADYIDKVARAGFYTQGTVACMRSRLRSIAKFASQKGRGGWDGLTPEDVIEFSQGRHDADKVRDSLVKFYQVRGGRNVGEQVRRLHQLPLRNPHADADDLAKFMAAKPERTSERDLAIFTLMFETGIRRCEVLAIQAADVHLKAEKVLIKSPKLKEERLIWLSEKAVAAVEAWNKLRKSLEPQSEQFFCNETGGELGIIGFQHIVRRRNKAAGTKVRSHMFRHNYATSLYESGAQLEDIRQLMGHKSRSMSAAYMKPVDFAKKAEAIAKLDAKRNPPVKSEAPPTPGEAHAVRPAA